MHKLTDYNYTLPERLIAQTSVKPADHAKLLYCKINKQWDMILKDKYYYDLPDILPSDSILFFNNSKVIRARIPLNNCTVIRNYLPPKAPNRILTLNKWEAFIYRIISYKDRTFEALVSDDKHFRPGSEIIINQQYTLQCIEQMKNWLCIRLHWWDLNSFLEKFAELPLPPYISYDKNKEPDYQNVFATIPGSVAAPTAWLHFTESLIHTIQKKWISIQYLTLHVSLGTFKPLNVENIADHEIHGEYVNLDLSIFKKLYKQKIVNKKITSVGTTSTRTLESLPYLRKVLNKTQVDMDSETKKYRNKLSRNISINEAKKIIDRKEWETIFQTKLYIYPWYKTRIIDNMITNFHLPHTSLLVLVSTFMWYSNRKRSYEHAVQNNYRFYSFGDWMIILND